MSVTREQVIKVLAAKSWQGKDITTLDVAQELGVDEYSVRGAISWLCVADVMYANGTVRRTDRFGRWYDACIYRWTGKTEIPKVRRNRDEREASRPVNFDPVCFNLLMGAICTKK